MASISDERLREMEEEMDRFEAEIEGPQGSGDGAGSSSTFDSVQAQLSAIRKDMSSSRSSSGGRPPPPPSGNKRSSESTNHYGDEDFRQPRTGQKRKLQEEEFYDVDERPGRPQGPPIAAPPPPPPPPPGCLPSGPAQNRFAPPPPPPGPGHPPPRPAFMPPQLRHRPPRPPFPPRPPGGMMGGGGGPQGMRPPPGANFGPPHGPQHMMGGPPMNQHGPPMMGGPHGPMPMGGPMQGGPQNMGPMQGGPMGGPQNMGPGPGPHGPMGGPGPHGPMMGPVRPMGPEQPQGPAGPFMPPSVNPNVAGPAQISAGPTVEQPKVVYAAAPVITVDKKKDEKKKKKKKKKADGSSETGDGSQSAASTDKKEDSSLADMDVAPQNTMVGGIMAAGSMAPVPQVQGMMDPMMMAAQMGMNPAINPAAMQASGMVPPGGMQGGMGGVPGMPGGAAVAGADGSGKKEKKKKEKKFIRLAASTTWEDPTLAEWAPDDFRMFCGDLGNEVTDETLVRAFNKYPSFLKAKVVRDRRSNKTKGYGFVSFKDPLDFTRAMREMNGKYVGNRPIKLRKSSWKDRSLDVVRKKEKEKKRLGLK